MSFMMAILPLPLSCYLLARASCLWLLAAPTLKIMHTIRHTKGFTYPDICLHEKRRNIEKSF